MTAIGPGTRVKCIRSDAIPWKFVLTGGLSPGPRFGSVWVVKNLVEWPPFGTMLYLTGWMDEDQCFAASNFRPLDGDAEIERLRAIAASPTRIGAPKREPAEVGG